MHQEITADQFEKLIQEGADMEIIDVREQNEWDMVRIPQAKLIPLSQLPNRYQEIDFHKDVYIFCRTGARSGQACTWLANHSKSATNVSGSIKALYEMQSRVLEVSPAFQASYLA